MRNETNTLCLKLYQSPRNHVHKVIFWLFLQATVGEPIVTEEAEVEKSGDDTNNSTEADEVKTEDAEAEMKWRELLQESEALKLKSWSASFCIRSSVLAL